MTTGIFNDSIDIIYFICGFVFILLAEIARSLRQRPESSLPWGYLSAFALLSGINQWLDMIAISLPRNVTMEVISLVLLAGSYILLMEFGRVGATRILGRDPGHRILAIILVLAATGSLNGLSGLAVSIRYALGLSGGLWSAWILWRARSLESEGKHLYFLAALAMLLYAFTTGLVVPRDSLFSASFNSGHFYRMIHIPIQLVRCLLIGIMAVALGRYCRKLRLTGNKNPIGGHKFWRSGWIMASLVLTIGGGWYATEIVSRHVVEKLRNNLVGRTRIVASTINLDWLERLKGQPEDLKTINFRRLAENCRNVCETQPDIRYVYLLGKRDGKVFFFLDEESFFKSDPRNPLALPGEVNQDASVELMNMFQTGQPVFEGPTEDKWGSWISALIPVTDPQTSRVLAVLGMDTDARLWQKDLASRRLAPIMITMLIVTLLMFFYVTQDYIQVSAAKIAASEEKFRSISASALDAIIMMSPEGIISFWNRAAERIFGYNQQEALGRNLHELLVPQRYHEAYDNAMPDFRHTGLGNALGRTLEMEGLRKDGTEFPVEMSLSSLQFYGEWHAVGILRDITERKRAEESLQRSKREIEEANRELALSYEVANRLAHEASLANAAKSEFLANMSHEIRTPMNGIIGMTGLIQSTALSGEQREFTRMIQLSSESLLSLINEILDFSKIEAHKMELERIDFDLRATLEDLNAILGLRAREKGLDYTCWIAPNVPTLLRGDPGRLRQILLNLAGNAIKFTARGYVTIHVAVEHENGDDITLRFEIKDTGIGIPKHNAEYLFQPFTQADSSITRRYGGTGLGLSISKHLAELMSGQIGVNSTQGEGSLFWFTAVLGKQPASAVWAHEAAAEVREESGAPATPSTHRRDENPRSSLRILLAEDNPVNQKVALKMLERMGYRADIVRNGREVLAALTVQPYDLVLMDVQMPEMDGLEATRRIRAPESTVRNHRIPIVAMTAHAMKGDREICLEAGMDDYLTKPIQLAPLEAALNHWLSLEIATPNINPAQAPLVKNLVFDQDSIFERVGRDQEVLEEVIQTFLMDAPQYILAIERAIEAHDFDKVRIAAHTLKGAAATLGMENHQAVGAPYGTDCRKR